MTDTYIIFMIPIPPTTRDIPAIQADVYKRQDNPDAPLYGYPAGTWGPLESEAMMHEHGADWTNPCKNLTNTDQ